MYSGGLNPPTPSAFATAVNYIVDTQWVIFRRVSRQSVALV